MRKSRPGVPRRGVHRAAGDRERAGQRAAARDRKFEKVTLNDRPGEPVSLAVLPDRRVLHTARTGEVRLFDPRTQLNTLAADVEVYEHDEEGLQGIAMDPNFDENRWVYLYYSPPGRHARGRSDDADLQRGRRAVRGRRRRTSTSSRARCASRASSSQGGKLDLDTEQKIIDVPVDRGICCHVGGQIDVRPAGQPVPVDR